MFCFGTKQNQAEFGLYGLRMNVVPRSDARRRKRPKHESEEDRNADSALVCAEIHEIVSHIDRESIIYLFISVDAIFLPVQKVQRSPIRHSW